MDVQSELLNMIGELNDYTYKNRKTITRYIKRYYIIVIVFSIICISIGYNNYKLSKKVSNLETVIVATKLTTDSIQRRFDLVVEHYKHCLWIDKDSIGIGYQGYLYSKYYRKWVKNGE